MGIDIHNLNFMAHASDLGVRFDASIGIGRQAVFVDDWMLARHRAGRGLPALKTRPSVSGAPTYFEPMLQQWFGARVVDSVDASPYEQAGLIHDMNLPWPSAGPLAGERGRFDAVLDFGCLEHVFDFPVAWRNCVDLCRVGGHLLHALPANNLSGHGFYQFSPELFFNLYRPERGFELKALYLALKADPSRWWQVANPLELRRRVKLCNSHEAYLLVLAKKLHEIGPLPAPQQSDYAEQEWLAPAGDADAAAAARQAQRPTAGSRQVAGGPPGRTRPDRHGPFVARAAAGDQAQRLSPAGAGLSTHRCRGAGQAPAIGPRMTIRP